MKFPQIALVAILGCSSFSLSYAEGNEEDRFVLLVEDAGPGVEQLLRQRPSDAIDFAEAAANSADSRMAHTVLCAALIAQRDLEAAQNACNKAVELAKVPLTTGMNPHGHSNREALAIAYSNRAVLHHLAGDMNAATADIKHALRQNRHIEEITRNQALVEKAYLANRD
ncbi:MAG: hypothetical protein K0U72_06445 [Gammaproteobacteria bacterium]|nr:hypothetical protein [Gammaproteobacteria bacterium]